MDSDRAGEDSRERDGHTQFANALAFPQTLLRYISPQQMEFFALGEDVLVEASRADTRSRLSRVLGHRRRVDEYVSADGLSHTVLRMPLHTYMAVRTYLAGELVLQGLEFMSKNEMKALIRKEQEEKELQRLPYTHERFYFFCYILVHNGLVPVPFDANKFLRQLNKLYTVRMGKILRSLSESAAMNDTLRCTNISDMELFSLRRRLTLFCDMTMAPSAAQGPALSQQLFSSASDSFMPESSF